MSDRPRSLVSAGWLAAHSSDPDLRIVHVSIDREVYDRRHVPGAVFCDLHEDLAIRGRDPATGDVERQYLLPDRASVEGSLRGWGVGPDDRVLFYDDVGRNRHAARGLWLLRLYGWPRDRALLLDGGLPAWERSGGRVTDAVPSLPAARPVPLRDADPALLAVAGDVLEWSRESSAGGPPRILDVRTPEEFRGEDLQARHGGHIPGATNLEWTAFLAADGTFRAPAEIRMIADAAVGGDASTLRAAHCQGGIRAAGAWFALAELAGLDVRNYSGSWEEWGNRDDLPIDR